MSIILVSDVFGKTPALMQLSEELNAKVIVDPYNGKNMRFENEAEAYSYFIEQVGLDAYLDKLLEITKSVHSDSTLIGFSIGASAIWRLSEKISANFIKRAICFYGSQIRYFTEISPLFEIELVFPKSESHFDVLELQANLSKKHNVKTIKVNYLHGFMNYYSSNYNKLAYREYVNLLSSNAS